MKDNKKIVFYRTPGKILLKKCKAEAKRGNVVAQKILNTKTVTPTGEPHLVVEPEDASVAAELFKEGVDTWYEEEKSKVATKQDRNKFSCKHQSLIRKYRMVRAAGA